MGRCSLVVRAMPAWFSLQRKPYCPALTRLGMDKPTVRRLRCARCAKPLRLGVNVFSVVEGIVSMHEIVALEEKVYCSEECLRQSLNPRGRVTVLKRRVP
jgi:hypothetical protein